jgi:ribosomal protein L11 methyltransferase
MQWLEVSLIVEEELAEAVAEVLARFAPDGIIIESTAVEADLQNEDHPVGPLRVCAYLPVDETMEERRERIEESLWHLGRIQSIPRPEFKTIQEIDWSNAWKTHYQPIAIGRRLIILPVWLDTPNEARIPVRINPGMAFGTGTHPTTQLCLRMLEDYPLAGKDIFDIGCGSGILSIAALKLGARHAYGVDIEAESINNAAKNAAANQVSKRVDFAVGSVEEIKMGLFNIKQAPLVLANLLTHILMRLLDNGLADLVAPGGVLILSGILDEQLMGLQTATQAHGLHIIDRRQIDDWVSLVLQR